MKTPKGHFKINRPLVVFYSNISFNKRNSTYLESVNLWSHMLHLKGFSPVWTLRRCSASLCASKKPLPHHSHACGRSFECLKNKIFANLVIETKIKWYILHIGKLTKIIVIPTTYSYIPGSGRGLKKAIMHGNFESVLLMLN